MTAKATVWDFRSQTNKEVCIVAVIEERFSDDGSLLTAYYRDEGGRHYPASKTTLASDFDPSTIEVIVKNVARSKPGGMIIDGDGDGYRKTDTHDRLAEPPDSVRRPWAHRR